MSLRDYFAAQAMRPLVDAWVHAGQTDPADVAADAYRIADAMIAERSKPR